MSGYITDVGQDISPEELNAYYNEFGYNYGNPRQIPTNFDNNPIDAEYEDEDEDEDEYGANEEDDGSNNSDDDELSLKHQLDLYQRGQIHELARIQNISTGETYQQNQMSIKTPPPSKPHVNPYQMKTHPVNTQQMSSYSHQTGSHSHQMGSHSHGMNQPAKTPSVSSSPIISVPNSFKNIKNTPQTPIRTQTKPTPHPYHHPYPHPHLQHHSHSYFQ